MIATFQALVEELDRERRDPLSFTYDAELVRQLEGTLRAEAEAELARRVEHGDFKAFETAAELGLDRIAPALERFTAQGGWARAAAGRALHLLRGDAITPSIDPILRGLDVYALKTSKHAEATRALVPFLGDTSIQARVHSAEGLVARLGLSPLAEPRPSPLRRMMLAQSSSLATLWPLGAAELRLVFDAILSGRDPATLDLEYRPSPDPSLVDAFWADANAWKPFDVDAVARMGPHDRSWAETVLIARLVNGDVNAAKALVALDVPSWAAHLEAALSFIGDRSPSIRDAYRELIEGASRDR